MSNRSSDVVKMLKDLAEKEVEAATQALAAAMKIADEAQSKYDVLLSYRGEYSQNLSQSLESGISAQAYQNFNSFFKKLDQAVNGQLQMVQTAKQHVQMQKKRWQETQRKKLSYEVLSQRQDDKALKVAQKKDQKLMDEFAMRTSKPHK
ncbi:MAG: flagellar export protein FliJ [Methylophilus sp.]|jgi:flagellar FliJ protein